MDDGTTISYTKGYAEPVYQCTCGRMQSAIGTLGPLCPDTVGVFGWERQEGQWLCPFCSGNEHKLKRVFGEGSNEEFQAYGRRHIDGH